MVALAGVGYLLGWQDARTYFAGFGAPWVVSLLTPGELLQRASGPLTTIYLGTSLGALTPVINGWSRKAVDRAETVGGLVAAALLLAGILSGDRLGQWAAVLSWITSLVFAFTFGCTLALPWVCSPQPEQSLERSAALAYRRPVGSGVQLSVVWNDCRGQE